MVPCQPSLHKKKSCFGGTFRRAQKRESHLLHKTFTERPQCASLKSICPFAMCSYKLLATSVDVYKANYIKTNCCDQFSSIEHTMLHCFVKGLKSIPRKNLSWMLWMTLNRLRMGVGLYDVGIKRWYLMDSASCDYVEPSQIVEYITNSCPVSWLPHSIQGLIDLENETLSRLASTELQL